MSRPLKKTVIVLAAISFLAAFAFSTADARAADNCLANPAAVAPAGAHWHYRTNRQTHQKCWHIGVGIANAQARVPVMAFGDDDTPAQPAARTSCVVTPGAPSGRHWIYQFDQATGQKCWQLNQRISRSGRTAGNRAKAAALAGFRKANANAAVRVQEAAPAPVTPDETAKPAAPAAQEVTYEELLRSTFGSRWLTDAPDPASANPPTVTRQTSPVSDDLARAHFEVDPPLRHVLAVFLMSLGGALALLALIGRSFFSRHSLDFAPVYPAALRLPYIDSDPDPVYETKEDELADALERDRYGIPFMARLPRPDPRGRNPAGLTPREDLFSASNTEPAI
jgi:hypothetical protein